jgi:hypothetical protein
MRFGYVVELAKAYGRAQISREELRDADPQLLPGRHPVRRNHLF